MKDPNDTDTKDIDEFLAEEHGPEFGDGPEFEGYEDRTDGPDALDFSDGEPEESYECPNCGQDHDADEVGMFCDQCGAHL